jgi:hypothetical protein
MRKITSLVIALLTALGMSVGMLGQASAAASCGSGYFCIYDDNNYSNSAAALTVPSTSCKNVASSLSWATNMANSAMNSTGYTLYLFDASNCTGAIGYTIYAGQHIPNLGSFSNKLSSFITSGGYCNLHC